MTPRLTRSEYERNKGEGNRQAMKALVDGGEVTGLLGFVGNLPVAWCSLGPRPNFSWLERSRIFKPVDDRAVWSIVCFFVAKDRRRQGLSVAMLEEACDFAASRGAECLEGYPVEPRKKSMPDLFAFNGIAATFLEAGFHEVARRSATRPIMRRHL